MNYELGESEAIQTGFVLASPTEMDELGETYGGHLEVLLSDPEESWAGHLMAMGIMTFFGNMKKFLVIYPTGTFNGTSED